MNLTIPARVLIAIPAFNEETGIGPLLDRLRPWKEDVLVIDDGSTDQTSQIVNRMGFRCHIQPKNAGLAEVYATAESIATAEGYSHILSLDGDGQHDPAFVPEFLAALQKYDLVSGNRFSQPERVPPPKLAANLFAILLFHEALGRFLPDVSCGFRGWKTGLFNSEKGLAPPASGSGPFATVYDRLLSHAAGNQPIGYVPIPAIYPPSEPLHTKIPEIIGLVTSLHAFKPSHTLQYILDQVRKPEAFAIPLENFNFEAGLVSSEAYLFKTNVTRAQKFFRSIQND